jgi:hypothetical protein
MDRNELIWKIAQETKPKRKPPVRKPPRKIPAAYPAYDKSVVTQRHGDPGVSGVVRGIGSGALGALLAALAAKAAGQERERVLLAGVLGGITAGVPGFVSGRGERESMNSRLLFLRRLGVQTPGELEAVTRYPQLAQEVTRKGRRV